jgi:DNA-binding GntR family transcriptional regulator
MQDDSLRQRAYRHIHSKILSGDLAAGQKVSEQALAEELGISRTPVRSAIHELESEGLVEQVPRYGTIVKKTERRDVIEFFELRQALESFAAEVAATRISPDDLERITVLCDRMYELVQQNQLSHQKLNDDDKILAQFVDADMDFHAIILRSTGNRRLMKSVADSRMMSQSRHHSRQPERIEVLAEAWDGHRQILTALLARDAERARAAMADHIRFSKEHALKIFDRVQAEGDAAELLHWTR